MLGLRCRPLVQAGGYSEHAATDSRRIRLVVLSLAAFVVTIIWMIKERQEENQPPGYKPPRNYMG
jgi:hypothetical protein